MVLTRQLIMYELNASSSHRIAEEALYRNLNIVNPETINETYKTLHNYMGANGSNELGFFSLGLTFVGAGLLASGIYNLCKKFKEETKKE